MMNQKMYVGDGVYAEIDRWGSVTLTTSNGVRDTNTIVLEREIWEALVTVRAAMAKRLAEAELEDNR